ncbi:LOW QUALITY PROTEIN: hypothetical protein TorRG33x02_308150 [Trema orientale]|uniref:Uncharacterized protein n=1 Tax=Trema orientale TaxID=63057 RepID=A0A2P5BUU7_TREOI|nr:LOW QUALITY PROTEIN: hypothetical protein TorRG33x02_308150 [Trema orientale]
MPRNHLPSNENLPKRKCYRISIRQLLKMDRLNIITNISSPDLLISLIFSRLFQHLLYFLTFLSKPSSNRCLAVAFNSFGNSGYNFYLKFQCAFHSRLFLIHQIFALDCMGDRLSCYDLHPYLLT